MTDVDVRVGQRMEIVGGVARLVENGEVIREFEIQELPQTFVQWQLDYKRRVYDAIEKDEYIAFNAGHLPVVATLNDEGLIPNLANKGVGFTPKDEYIEHYVKLVEDAVEQIIKLPPHAVDDTRALRIATAREFYKHPEHIDWRRLGLLEIFEGETYRNLTQAPAGVGPVDRRFSRVRQLPGGLRGRDHPEGGCALPLLVGDAPAVRIRAVPRRADDLPLCLHLLGGRRTRQDAEAAPQVKEAGLAELRRLIAAVRRSVAAPARPLPGLPHLTPGRRLV